MEHSAMYQLLESCKGDLNKWEIAFQNLETGILNALLSDKGKIQKLRNGIQKIEFESRAIKICKVFEKFNDMAGSLVKPTQEKFAEEMVFALTNAYGADFQDGFGLGVGLSVSDIRSGIFDELDRIQGLVERIQKANFSTAARTLADLGDKPLVDAGALGDIWAAVADCRNLQNALEPRHLDAGYLGTKYGININWKLMWTTEGLFPQSEELPFESRDCIYEGQEKFDS